MPSSPAPQGNYVLALLFTTDGARIALMRRTRPAWQAGRINALGGKLRPRESVCAGASREVREEAGVEIPAAAWEEMLIWDDPMYRLHVVRAFHDSAKAVRTMEDQEVFLAQSAQLPAHVIDNLRWLVPLALDRDVALPVRVHSADPHGSGLTELPSAGHSRSVSRESDHSAQTRVDEEPG
jgi:8-oxo-dGTP diphosphatase